jgi:ABC-type transport system involved in multi-copper enzyme maturation permease subunit
VIPILRKELRTMLRERRGFLVPVLYAMTLSTLVGLYFLSVKGGPAMLGKRLAGTVAGLQAAALLIFAPIVGASMVAGERERGTWARLLSSPAKRDGILLGKLAACWLYLFLLLSISFPIAALSLLYGGLDLGSLAGLYLIHACAAACLASIGLAVSTGFARTWTASFLALGITLALVVGLPALGAVAHLASSSPFPHSVYSAAAEQRATLVVKVTDWFNPMYGMELFFDPERAARSDWFAHYAAMLALAGGAFLTAQLRIRRAGE